MYNYAKIFIYINVLQMLHFIHVLYKRRILPQKIPLLRGARRAWWRNGILKAGQL